MLRRTLQIVSDTRKGDRGTFKLAALDGARSEGFYSDDHIKKSVSRRKPHYNIKERLINTSLSPLGGAGLEPP